MNGSVKRRHSYPHLGNPQDFAMSNPSAADLHAIPPQSIEGLNPEATSYRLDRGTGSNNSEIARYSTSDFNKDLENIQSEIDEP